MSVFQRHLSRAVRRVLSVAEYGTIVALVGLGLVITLVGIIAPESGLRDWLRTNYEDLLVGLLVALVFGGGLILAALKRIEGNLDLDAFRRIDSLISQLDGRERLLAPELRKASDQLQHFFAEGVFVIHGRRPFQEFWLTAIRSHPGADILATSLPSINFFWNAEDIHEAMRANVQAGGDVKRLFFLNQDEPTPHDHSVMSAQAALGVDVYYCNKNKLAPDAREIALVDKDLRFGWRVEVSTDDLQRAEVMTKKKSLGDQYGRLAALFARTDIVVPLAPHAPAA